MARVIGHFLTALVLGAAALLAGCNTMEGAGKDMEAGGEKVQDAARQDER